jgi:hypothetical protein
MSDTGTNGTATMPSSLPLFYKQPRVLDPAAHASAKVKPLASFAFAAQTNSVPIGADEFLMAQASYPIVFTSSDPPVALAVLGLAPNRNLFVERSGAWRRDFYIPAYVRRYPFVFVKPEGRDQYILAIDEASESLSNDDGQPLFSGSEPSELTRNALQFCAAFQRQHDASQAFAKALSEQKLLVEHRAELRPRAGGSPTTLRGFRVIDEAKFNALERLRADWNRVWWFR